MEILLSAEHRSPGRDATAAVGEGADDPVAQAIVVALPFTGREHRGCRTGAEQLLLGVLKTTDPRDTAILGALRPLPLTLTIPLQGHHPDPEIGHRFIRDRTDLLQTSVAGRQFTAVDDAIAGLQNRHEVCEGQRLTHHLLEALHPGHGADVFEVHRHRCPVRTVLDKAEVIVVEPEAAVAEWIAPCRQQLGPKSLRDRQPVLHRQLPVGGPLLRGVEAITVYRQGHPHRMKRKSFGRTAVAPLLHAARQSLGRQHTGSAEAEQGEHGTTAHRSSLNRCKQRCGGESAPQSSLTEAD